MVWDKIKEIIKDSFYQLLIVYTLIVFLISVSLLYKYTLHFEILALILAIFGIFILYSKEETSFLINKKLHIILFILAIALIIIFRIIPFLNNSIPLGYDSGIYKYGIEHGLSNLDKFVVQGTFEPGFLYFMKLPTLIFSSHFILTYLLIGFCVLLGISIYLVSKEFFNKETGLIALLIYSLSIIQFKTFAMMYYKNIIALAVMLFSLFFLAKYENSKKKINIILFIILAGVLGGLHRPTFYIFGLSYFAYAFISPYQDKKYDFKTLFFNVLIGVIILGIAISMYFGKFMPQVTNMIEPTLEGFTSPGEAPGTFISFVSYQFLTLAYLAFAIIGGLLLLRKKKFNNILLIWLIINACIVYFQFFFFNRFIIHLDIVLLIFASLGFVSLINNKKKLGIIVLLIMLVSAGFLVAKESINAKPHIDKTELIAIEYLQNTPQESYVMATSSKYSPFVLGYSNRKTIAPGLFDYDKHNRAEWTSFWSAKNITDIKVFMDIYEKPLYVFIGKKQNNNLKNYTECFKTFYEQDNNYVYEYVC